MQYTFTLGNRLYFRRRIPTEYREALGIAEIRRGLPTNKIESAKAIVANLNAQLEKVFVALASGLTLDLIAPVIGLKIRKRANAKDKQELISVFYKRFHDEMILTKRWNAKTENENLVAFNFFIKLCDDKPIDEITHASLLEYRQLIQKLPPNATKGKKTRDINLRKLAGMAHKQTISVTRVNHLLMPLTGLFAWLHKHEIISHNPAHNLLLPKVAMRPDEQRNRYSNEQIKQIFDEVRHFKDLEAPRYWRPLIAAFSGMRVNEICQLRLEDLREVDGIWVFDVNNKQDKSTKNLSSLRLLPIHPYLLNAGLLKYANDLHKNNQTRLFPTLKKHKRNGHGHQIIQWWSRFKSKISSDRKLSFHSFRHSFGDQFKQMKTEPAIIAELMGHSTRSITLERYGKRFSPKILYEAIEKLNYG